MNIELLTKYEEFFVKSYNSLKPNGYNFGPPVNPNFRDRKHSDKTINYLSRIGKDRWKVMPKSKKKIEIKKLHAHRQSFLDNETIEQKQERYNKISQANKGFVHSKEAIEKNRQAHLGKILTEETKQKMSIAKLGKKKSEETRENMCLAQRKRVSEDSRQRTIKIREMLSQGMRGVDIARIVGCTPEYIYKVKKGERGCTLKEII